MVKKILLVDDSETQLDILKTKLEKNGYEIEVAYDGMQGYMKVFEFAPDIVLSDIIMPNLDGYQLCRLLKNNHHTKNIPVILLTVMDKKMNKFWSMKAGAEKFISKLGSTDELTQSVEELLEKHPVSNDLKETLNKQFVNEESVHNDLNKILNNLLMKSVFLNEFRDLSDYLSHEQELVKRIFTLLSSFLDYDLAGILFLEADDHKKETLYCDPNQNDFSQYVLEDICDDVSREIFMGNKRGCINAELIMPQGNNERITSIEDLRSKLLFPIRLQNKIIGGICFYSQDNIDYQGIDFFDIMATELNNIFSMKYLYGEKEFLSVTDGLTGLYNRRQFNLSVEREFLRSKRINSDLSLAIIDIDHFKNINDTFGHQYGDSVLKEMSQIIKTSFRRTDMVYRYGGEELVIILPDAKDDNAVQALERLRQKIENYTFYFDNTETKVTISIGVCSMEDQYTDVHEFIESADKALYNAKKTGRNQVVFYNYEQSKSAPKSENIAE